MTTQDFIGVTIDKGARDWQIYQQNAQGVAEAKLSGRWRTLNKFKTATVLVRVLVEDEYRVVSRSLQNQPAETLADGTWSISLTIPRGGLYRIETCIQFDGGPVEWAQRGDMVHHVGVGDVWVITGQSNSAGYGKSPVNDGPELGIHMFHADGQWKLATHPLGDSSNSKYPANREFANASHSPYLNFARILKRKLGYPIGLIPAALGGSPMSAWTRKVDGRLFTTMLGFFNDSNIASVTGVCWYQGESDANPDLTALYETRFLDFLADLRASLNNPNLPIITAQLNRYVGGSSSDPHNAHWEAMRELQRQIARKTPGVYIISTLDLGLSDGIHNNSVGNLEIGQRMASIALAAVHQFDISHKHPDLRSASRAVLEDKPVLRLAFDNIGVRLFFENNALEQLPFVVTDEQGRVPVVGYGFDGPDVMILKLGRPLAGKASVTGGQSAAPPSVVPFDIDGFRPMLAFKATC